MGELEFLIEDYKRKVETLKQMMNDVKKPNNTSSNPDYARLQTKMNCYRAFIAELSRAMKTPTIVHSSNEHTYGDGSGY